MKVLYVILVSYASAGLAQAALVYAYRSKDGAEVPDQRRSSPLENRPGAPLARRAEHLRFDHAHLLRDVRPWRLPLLRSRGARLAVRPRGSDRRPDLRLRVLLHASLSIPRMEAPPRVSTPFTMQPGIQGTSTASCCTQSKPFSGSACSSGRWPSSAACTSTLWARSSRPTPRSTSSIMLGSTSRISHSRPWAFSRPKHDRHHHSMLSGNYASITPLPDIIFGTVE